MVLPATHFGEKEGTYTNRKGRVQKLNAAVIPPEGALQDAKFSFDLLGVGGREQRLFAAARDFQALSREIPAYGKIDYDSIGDQGIELGVVVAEHHDR